MDSKKDIETSAAINADRELGDNPKGRNLLSDPELGSIVLNEYELAEFYKGNSRRDTLTNLLNRTGVVEEFNLISSNLERLNKFSNYSLIALDLIGLKRLNKQFGHSGADEIIKNACNSLESSVRKTDLVSRWGGDEFIVVGINTESEGTKRIINEINNNLPEHVKYCIVYKIFDPKSPFVDNLKNILNHLEKTKDLRPHDENGRVMGSGVVVELD